MAQIKGGLFAKGGGNGGGVGFPVIEISLAQIDGGNFNFTEEQFNQIMACGNFTLKLPDGTFYNFVGSNNSQQASVFFYAIHDNQTVSPTELTILQLSIVKSTYVGTISPNVYTNGGGGKQLYQHNISMNIYTSSTNFKLVKLQILSDNLTQMTASDVLSWLHNKGFDKDPNMTNKQRGYLAIGIAPTSTSNSTIVEGIAYQDSSNFYLYTTRMSEFGGTSFALNSITDFVDTVIAL